jgi:hypothetical protein
MREHDGEDSELGHADDTHRLLGLLVDRHNLDDISLEAAALVPQLSWSFLDGIRCHYSQGDAAVIQRLGWHLHA